MNGVLIRMAAIKLTILRLALAPRISLLICPSFSTFAIQISLGPIALCEVRQAQQRRLERRRNKERRQR